jgi:hypothetical protein
MFTTFVLLTLIDFAYKSFSCNIRQSSGVDYIVLKLRAFHLMRNKRLRPSELQ